MSDDKRIERRRARRAKRARAEALRPQTTWQRTANLAKDYKILSGLAHVVEGVLVWQLVTALIFLAFGWRWGEALLFGAIACSFHFWGREKRDFENKFDVPISQPWRGFLPFRWHKDAQLDFYLPTTASFFLVFLAW